MFAFPFHRQDIAFSGIPLDSDPYFESRDQNYTSQKNLCTCIHLNDFVMMGFNFALCLSVDRMLFGNIQIKIRRVKKDTIKMS